MHILIALTYYRPHYSGLTIHTEREAIALVERGHQVTVLTSRFDEKLAWARSQGWSRDHPSQGRISHQQGRYHASHALVGLETGQDCRCDSPARATARCRIDRINGQNHEKTRGSDLSLRYAPPQRVYSFVGERRIQPGKPSHSQAIRPHCSQHL